MVLYCAYSIFLVKKIVYSSLLAGLLPGLIDNMVDVAVLLTLLTVSALKIQKNAKDILLYLVLLSMGLIVKLVSTNLTFMWVIAFIFAFRGENFDKACKLTLFVTGISLLMVTICAQTGIIEDHIWETEARGGRHGLGFLYPSYLGLYFLNFTLVFLLYRRKAGVRHLLLLSIALLIINHLIYKLTDTRATYYLVIAAIFGFNIIGLVRHCKKNIPIPLIALSSFAYLPCALLSIAMTALYDSSVGWQAALNKLLSGRLSLIHASFENYGVLLFGRHVEMAATAGKLNYDGTLASLGAMVDTNVIDNSYMSILILQGAVAFIVVMLGLGFLAWTCLKKKDGYPAFVLLILAVHAIVDPQLLKIEYNTIILLIGCTLPFCKEKSLFSLTISSLGREINNRDIANKC